MSDLVDGLPKASPDTRALNPELYGDGPAEKHPALEAVPLEEWGERSTSEYAMQRDLFTWRDQQMAAIPELERLFAVPNGQYRRGQRPEPGLTAGVLDVFLDVPAGGLHGLRLELKVGKNRPTAEQAEWLSYYHSHGYWAAVVYDDWRRAANEILEYLGYDWRLEETDV